MATIHLTDHAVDITLHWTERLAGLMGDRRIPLSAITSVDVVDDALRATAGLRAPGLALPGRRKIGTWRGDGRRAFVCVRAGQPAVRIEATGLDRDVFLVGADDAAALADRVRSALHDAVEPG